MTKRGGTQSVDGRRVEVLFPQSEIVARVAALAAEIEKDYRGKDLVVVGVLKGAFIFMSDLVRSIDIPLACDFLRVASYENDKSTGMVRLEFDVTQPVIGRDVLIVEDIVDSGRTLKRLVEHMRNHQPRSLKVASLLYKETGAGVRGLVDYVGFETPDRYVVGYGLDSEGLYRSLPYIGVLVAASVDGGDETVGGFLEGPL